jgi:hypothetical protein
MADLPETTSDEVCPFCGRRGDDVCDTAPVDICERATSVQPMADIPETTPKPLSKRTHTLRVGSMIAGLARSADGKWAYRGEMIPLIALRAWPSGNAGGTLFMGRWAIAVMLRKRTKKEMQHADS